MPSLTVLIFLTNRDKATHKMLMLNTWTLQNTADKTHLKSAYHSLTDSNMATTNHM